MEVISLRTRDINVLTEKAKRVRRNILECIGTNKKGHLGGSMSSADLVTALYFYKMNHNPQKADDPNRDRFIFSKGHSVLAQYSALAEWGYFPKEELCITKSLGSLLQGHPEIKTPGIEANTGSLGQGLSIGVGIALGGKLDKRNYNVYAILGDGELAEGQIWEALAAASVYSLDNLVAIVDYNGLQASGTTEQRYNMGNIVDKFAAFGWNTIEIDGHNMEEIVDALDETETISGKPTIIIAKTTKGKGVSFAENVVGFHNGMMTEEEYELATKDISNL